MQLDSAVIYDCGMRLQFLLPMACNWRPLQPSSDARMSVEMHAYSKEMEHRCKHCAVFFPYNCCRIIHKWNPHKRKLEASSLFRSEPECLLFKLFPVKVLTITILLISYREGLGRAQHREVWCAKNKRSVHGDWPDTSGAERDDRHTTSAYPAVWEESRRHEGTQACVDVESRIVCKRRFWFRWGLIIWTIEFSLELKNIWRFQLYWKFSGQFLTATRNIHMFLSCLLYPQMASLANYFGLGRQKHR